MSESEYELLDFLLTESQRRVTWLAIFNNDARPDASMETLDQVEPLIKRGGVPQVTCRPLIFQLNMRNPFLFAAMSSWNRVFNQPPEKQKEIYRDPEFRQAFRATLNKSPGRQHHGQEPRDRGAGGRQSRAEALSKANRWPTSRSSAAPTRSTRCWISPIEDDLQVNFVLPLLNADESQDSATDLRSAHDDWTVRRRRACRHAVRRRLLHLPDRHLGARQEAR